VSLFDRILKAWRAMESAFRDRRGDSSGFTGSTINEESATIEDEEPPGGYPADLFIQPPPRATLCPICQQVLRQALRVCNNDHMYCASCLAQWTTPRRNSCPECRSVMRGQPARTWNNFIQELTVRCGSASQEERDCAQAAVAAAAAAAVAALAMPTAKKQKVSKDASPSQAATPPAPLFCDWTGAVAAAAEHKKVCLFEKVKCPFPPCGQRTLRKDMEAHKAACCKKD
jgi:hypothetical protein